MTCFGNKFSFRLARVLILLSSGLCIAFSLRAQPSAPLINTQPTNLTVNFGQPAFLTVVATGDPVPEYQWQFNGNPRPGETNATLIIPNAQISDTGNYAVIVSNVHGALTSAVARLTVVTQPPEIMLQPTNLTATAGQSASMIVEATGNPAPSYQWFFNGLPLASAVQPTLRLLNVRETNSGAYFVVVSNLDDSVTSEVVTLTVNPAPTDPGKPDIDFFQASAFNNLINALAVQPDGKILIAGNFTDLGGVLRRHLARLLPNGDLDLTFSDPAVDSAISALALQADGKFLIGGQFGGVTGQSRPRLARFLANGALDTNFNAGFPFPRATALAAQPDGKIVVGWRVEGFNSYPLLNRFNADGTLDPNFRPLIITPDGGVMPLPITAYAVVVQRDGKVILGSELGILRFLPNGVSDPSFIRPRVDTPGMPFVVRAVALQNDGKILIGGYFFNLNGLPRFGLARLNPDGTVDPDFNIAGGPNNSIYSLAVENDGRVLIGGNFATVAGVGRSGIARLNADGSLDPTFDPGTGVQGLTRTVNAIAFNSDFQPLIAGHFSTVNGAHRRSIAQLYTDPPAPPAITSQPIGASVGVGQDIFFSVAVTCPPAPAYQWRVNGVKIPNAMQPVLALANIRLTNAGNYTVVVTNSLGSVTSVVATLTVSNAPVHSGSLDVDWAGAGVNDTVYAILSEPDGRTIIGGAFTSVLGVPRRGMARFNTDGSLDLSFNPGTNFPGAIAVYAVARQSTGKILVGGGSLVFGTFGYGFLRRFHTNGAPDNSWAYIDFVTSTVVYTLAIGGDDRVYYGGNVYSGIRRVDVNGFHDFSFQGVGLGYPNAPVYAIALQSDGKVLVGGQFNNVGAISPPRSHLLRVHPDGRVDSTFTGYNPSGPVHALALHSDGSVYVGGAFTNIHGAVRGRIAKLNTNGVVDPVFAPTNGASSTVRALLVQSCGKVIIGGAFTNVAGVLRRGLARLNAEGTLDTSYYPGSGFDAGVHALAEQAAGKILVGGDFTQVNGVPCAGIARLLGDFFIFNEALEGNIFSVSFATVSDRNYVLEFKHALNDAAWTAAASVVGDGSIKTLSDTDATEPKRFYRVRVE